VVTSYKKYLHPQHVVDRFLDGYGCNGTYHHPEVDVGSLYVDQRCEGTSSRRERFGIPR
jgi:hypothetical protein